MADTKTGENIKDLKEKLWKKIQILEDQLNITPEKAAEFRKLLDAYHKFVKAYLDILKVQAYAPGGFDSDAGDLSNLLSRLKSGEELRPQDKQTLQIFKRAISLVTSETTESAEEVKQASS